MACGNPGLDKRPQGGPPSWQSEAAPAPDVSQGAGQGNPGRDKSFEWGSEMLAQFSGAGEGCPRRMGWNEDTVPAQEPGPLHCPPFPFPDSVHCPRSVHFWTLASWTPPRTLAGQEGRWQFLGGFLGGFCFLLLSAVLLLNFKGLEWHCRLFVDRKPRNRGLCL